jgi:nucleotide-binding universal stress UspA family protein
MPPFSPAVHGVLAPSPLASNEDGRLELLGVLRETLAAVPGTEQWEKRAVIGMPASVINGLAGDAPRALILMGLGHHGRLDRLFGGETTVPVIQHAKVPVLVVASDARVLPRRAVAAVDFSEASMAAAAVAAELLDDDGTLTLAHVDSFGDAKAQPGDLVDLYRAGARARLDAAVRQVQRRTQRRVNGISLHGEIAEALLEYAARANCDLIALGGHELGLVDRILLGSIRTKVVRGAKCSVLIAPPEQHGTDA